MFNLSSVVLSQIETIALGLGLSYIPTSNIKKSTLISSWGDSCQKLHRRLCLGLHFAREENYLNDSSIPFLKSAWMPTRQSYTNRIDCYIDSLKQTGIQIIKEKHFKKCKVDNYLVEILNNLRSNPNIIIKPADKNLGLAIMDRTQYINMCLTHLQDNNTYELIDNKKVGTAQKRAWATLKRILIKYEKMYSNSEANNRNNKDKIRSKLADSLLRLEPTVFNTINVARLGLFYNLPKMHKRKGNIVPGRPIVSAPGTMTYYASVYVNNLLTPFLRKIPTVCFSSKNTIDEIDTIFGNPCILSNSPDTVILTADVNSLYPSIPIEAGITACRDFLEEQKCDDELLKLIIDLLHWILTNNYCEFNSQCYLQILGTAMGTPVAPTYAQIFLYQIERKYLYRHFCLFYKRYIDDIFSIFLSLQYARDFVEKFNNTHQTITLDPSSVHIGDSGIFLDLEFTITKVNENFIMQHKIYQKPLNKYSYIPACSSHLPSVFSSFILEELKRYRRACTHYEDFLIIAEDFRERLRVRGYTCNLFNTAILEPSLHLEKPEKVGTFYKVPSAPTLVQSNNSPTAGKRKRRPSRRFDSDPGFLAELIRYFPLSDPNMSDASDESPEPTKRARPTTTATVRENISRATLPPRQAANRKLFFVTNLPALRNGHFPFHSLLEMPEAITKLPHFAIAFESSKVFVGHENSKSIASYLLSSKLK